MIYYVYQTEEPTEGFTVETGRESAVMDLMAAIQDSVGGCLQPGFSVRCEQNGFIEIDWTEGGCNFTYDCVLLTKPVKGYLLSYDSSDYQQRDPVFEPDTDIQWGLHGA